MLRALAWTRGGATSLSARTAAERVRCQPTTFKCAQPLGGPLGLGTSFGEHLCRCLIIGERLASPQPQVGQTYSIGQPSPTADRTSPFGLRRVTPAADRTLLDGLLRCSHALQTATAPRPRCSLLKVLACLCSPQSAHGCVAQNNSRFAAFCISVCAAPAQTLQSAPGLRASLLFGAVGLLVAAPLLFLGPRSIAN